MIFMVGVEGQLGVHDVSVASADDFLVICEGLETEDLPKK